MFAGSIFLYHSELWTLTKTLSDSIDAFHHRQIRYAIGIVYPSVISNAKLYKLTKAELWSRTIERHKLMQTVKNAPKKSLEVVKPNPKAFPFSRLQRSSHLFSIEFPEWRICVSCNMKCMDDKI